MRDSIFRLLRSRAFILAVLDVVALFVVQGLGLPADVWEAVNVLVLVLIGKMGVEDAAAKWGGNHPSQL